MLDILTLILVLSLRLLLENLLPDWTVIEEVLVDAEVGADSGTPALDTNDRMMGDITAVEFIYALTLNQALTVA